MKETIDIVTEDGKTEAVTVRALRVSEYPKALAHKERNEEGRILEFACDRPPCWSDTLAPDSYEAAWSAFERVSPSFFKRAARRMLDLALRAAVVEGVRSGGSGGVSG